MQRGYLALLAAAGLLAACSSPKTEDTMTEDTIAVSAPAEEWTSLFDGKTLNGWSKYGGGEVGKGWKVENGELYLDAANKDSWKDGDGGDIVTNEEYENFHFKTEWKISPKGNSGIIFLVHESPEFGQTYHTGLEMQVLDNDGHPDGKIISHRSGDLYDLIVSSEETVKPVGEWNQAEVIVNQGKLDLILNGVTVVSTTLWTPEWDALVAGSKFKDMPGFGKYKKGKIALQDHGDVVHYRNLVIKKL
jgi:hypothetical protein